MTIGHLRSKLRGALGELDPTPRLMAGLTPGTPFTLVGVYRRTNAHFMRALVASAPSVALWALDEPDPALEPLTIGVGPGDRFPLLNRLIASSDTPYIVIADDDVAFLSGTPASLVAIADGLQLDLCQPAHGRRSSHGHAITRRQPFSVVRLTNFVDIGPVLVVGPRLRDFVLPLPEDAGMGWGVELIWRSLVESRGARLGVVDATPIRHVGAIGASYSRAAEEAKAAEALEHQGATAWSEVQRTLAVLRPWSPTVAQLRR